jgi:surface protein
MIYLERTVVIENSTAYIEEPIYLYKGDKNIEIRFAIQNNPFKYKNDLTMNYGQLIIKRKSAPNIFSEVTKLNGGRIILTITGEMIDELSELGSYTFQIRLYNEYQTSRGTLPPVENGIVIVEPLCEEPLEPPKVYVNPDFYEARTNGGTNYNYLFHNYTGTELDLSAWDTSNVTNMNSMFYYCTNLTSLDLSSFDTSKVTTMLSMFYNCYNLTSLDLSNFDMSNVTNMNSMLGFCRKLHTLRLDNCNNDTISKIITSSSLSTGIIEGVTRKIYCKGENAAGLTAPNNWVFEYID